jgi:hypothetical protein
MIAAELCRLHTVTKEIRRDAVEAEAVSLARSKGLPIIHQPSSYPIICKSWSSFYKAPFMQLGNAESYIISHFLAPIRERS